MRIIIVPILEVLVLHEVKIHRMHRTTPGAQHSCCECLLLMFYQLKGAQSKVKHGMIKGLADAVCTG